MAKSDDIWLSGRHVADMSATFSAKDVNAKLVAERGLAHILVGTKGVPLLGDPLLLDAEVGAINCHETIVQLVVDEMALEIDLWFCERATTTRGRVRLHSVKTQREKKTYHLVC